MTHEIAFTNGMHAFTRRMGSKPAWHGLGGETPADAPLEVWARNSGLEYAILDAPVLYVPHGPTGTDTARPMAGRRVLYRNDTGSALGLVSDRYQVVQPATVLEFFRDLTTAQGWKMETAGALRGGATYWALASTGDACEPIPGDVTKGYMLLATSCDGSLATHARETSVRVVCANTLSVAMLSRAGKSVCVKHSTTFDQGAVKRDLGLVDTATSWEAFSEQLKALAEIRVDSADAREFFARLLRPTDERAEAKRSEYQAESFGDLLSGPVRTSRTVATLERDKPEREIRGLADMLECYNSAPGAAPGTAYGLVQGVTRYVDHVRGKDADKRLTSAWFGQGDALKTTAFEKALALA